jgi:pimeloyl-ACP methyl ester carboxylesterase
MSLHWAAHRKRVRLLVLAAIGAVATVLAVSAQAASARPDHADAFRWPGGPKPVIVLEHGAWADAASWDKVIGQLREDGFTVYAPPNTLRGLPQDSASLHAFLTQNAALAGQSVVLVGHSYGGAVVSEAGTHEKVNALVYVTAFVPDAGESVNTLISGFPADGPQPPILPPRNGFLFLDKERFHESFAGDVPADEAAFMADSQVPWGLDALGGPVTEPAWRSKPSWYLVATDDRMIPPVAQRSMAERAGAKVTEVPGSHAIYVSRPEVVAEIIKDAAAAL